MMRAVALRFGNCLGSDDQLWQALRGDAVFYVCDEGPVVVRLVTDRLTGQWFIDEMKGPQNKTPRRSKNSTSM
jgi:hypothetical protein